jgi:hypothetical protein
MERRDLYTGLNDLINLVSGASNSRANNYYVDPRQVRAQREAIAREQALERARLEARERARAQERYRAQAQPSKKEDSPNGFGYFLATVAGLAAGFLFKSFFSSEEKNSQAQEEETNRGSANYSAAQESEKEADPTDPELEQCNDLVCPITLEVMNEPVISKKCGHSFEESAIVRWLGARDYCPKCHATLTRGDLVKNYSLKHAIDYMRKQAKTKDAGNQPMA